MKALFEELWENSTAKKILGRDILNGCQGHAYIIEGETGSGKHTLALLTAAAAACSEKDNPLLPLPCGKCPPCRKVLSGNSPDVIYIRGETKAKMSIGVEQIRSLKYDIYISANETERKTYIIEDAHTMTPQAQNAFLTSLEEPPPHILYLLLTSDSSLLLETVRSRAPTVKTEVLSPRSIEEYLIKNNKNAERMHKNEPEKLKEIAASARGIIGNAITLLDPKKNQAETEKRRLACEIVDALRASAVPEAYYTMASMPQKRDELEEIFFLALSAVRDILVYKSCPGAELCFFSGGDERLEKLSAKISRKRLIALYSALDETISLLKINVSLTSAMYALVSKIK